MILLLTALLCVQSSEPPPALVDAITADGVFAHVSEIASDEYQGREAGTPSADKAAEYIAAKLNDWKYMPLTPAGASFHSFSFAAMRGMYFQSFAIEGKATRNVLAVL